MRVEVLNAAELGDELELAGIEIREESEDGFILAVYEEDERVLYVLGVASKRKGWMKRKICELCERFGTDTVEFVNIVNAKLAFSLLENDPSAIVRVFRTGYGENVLNIRVTWRCP